MNRRIFELVGAFSCQYDKIGADEPRPVSSIAFPNEPFDAIALHRSGNVLARNDNAKPRLAWRTRQCQQEEVAPRNLDAGFGEHGAIVGRSQQPRRSGEAEGGHCGRVSRRWQRYARIQAEMRRRPLARRLASTWRPARVAMRALKPCVLARLILLGWKVLFIPASKCTAPKH